MPSGGCFVDVGSNRGPFACLAGRAVGDQGTVVAVEPNRTLWRPLLTNLERHVGGRFLFVPAAIAEGPGWMSLVVDSTAHTGGGHLAVGSESGAPGTEVPVRPVKTAIAPFIPEDSPELRIKIDVEGAELIVLRSLAGILERPECRGVLVEICPEYLDRFGGSREEIYAFMDECGFDPRLDRDEADEILRRDTVYDQWFQRRD
ncbi:MAG: FkbM family methyltransferase [Planctomycetota bacterium]|nr:FkbM family methyltransferase [Planctomycetota bacterium]MEE2895049.1 FkbM family methyltransferase [Planctomycetota bacterium]